MNSFEIFDGFPGSLAIDVDGVMAWERSDWDEDGSDEIFLFRDLFAARGFFIYKSEPFRDYMKRAKPRRYFSSKPKVGK